MKYFYSIYVSSGALGIEFCSVFFFNFAEQMIIHLVGKKILFKEENNK